MHGGSGGGLFATLVENMHACGFVLGGYLQSSEAIAYFVHVFLHLHSCRWRTVLETDHMIFLRRTKAVNSPTDQLALHIKYFLEPQAARSDHGIAPPHPPHSSILLVG